MPPEPNPILPASAEWWRDAVFYQIYIRSFADGNGDGVGDLAGIRSRLPYLADLGVDALWITPFYPSPMADHGYDVADPRDVEPVFGDLAEFDGLLADAHALGVRVTIDLVPNHSSHDHEWFRAALDAPPGSPERARYVFREGRGPDGSEPPNNWPSIFGGPAWTRVPDGQWYLHIFAPEQPDLNFDNPEVVADLEQTMRFWLDRGVDGFRIDVAHGMAKPEGLPDMVLRQDAGLLDDLGADDLRFDQDGVHTVHRRIRAVLDEYPGRMAVGEVWVSDDVRLAQYLRDDELQLAFNFKLLTADWTAHDLRDAVTDSLAAVAGTPAPACWVLSNHDRPRHVTRYGGGELGTGGRERRHCSSWRCPERSTSTTATSSACPTSTSPTRPCRTPSGSGRAAPSAAGTAAAYRCPGRGPSRPTDSPRAATPGCRCRRAGRRSPRRRRRPTPRRYSRCTERRWPCAPPPRAFAGESLDWLPAPDGCLAFRRSGGLVCLVNLSGEPIPLPEGRVLLASADLGDGTLPDDAAVWLQA